RRQAGKFQDDSRHRRCPDSRRLQCLRSALRLVKRSTDAWRAIARRRRTGLRAQSSVRVPCCALLPQWPRGRGGAIFPATASSSALDNCCGELQTARSLQATIHSASRKFRSACALFHRLARERFRQPSPTEEALSPALPKNQLCHWEQQNCESRPCSTIRAQQDVQC